MYLSTEYCSKCDADTDHHDGKCSDCFNREEKERIAKWNAMTVDERLTSLRERLEELEFDRRC